MASVPPYRRAAPLWHIRAMDDSPVAFAGPERPIIALLAGQVGAALRPLLRGWPAMAPPHRPEGAPVLSVVRQNGGYAAMGAGGESSAHDSVEEAANAVAGLLIAAVLDQTPARICLHASAAASRPAPNHPK